MKKTFLFLIFVYQTCVAQTLTNISSFGTNPGNLSMYIHQPSGIVGSAPIVVVLHGCTQTAQQAADQTGWNKLADANKFYVIYPEQSIFNNSNRCFNWFLSGDQEKNQGENLSIKQMVDYMKNNFTIDNSKIFVTGLSAGAAMTSVACATYPEVYAGGAILAGSPYKSATNAFEASNAMQGIINKTPSEWANLVFAQNPGYTGKYPRILTIQGTSDFVVNSNNQTELLDQWLAVHNINNANDRFVYQYTNNNYVDLYDYYTNNHKLILRRFVLNGFGHAVPIDEGNCPQQGGQAATYAIDVNFHSTWHIAHFFELIDTTASTLSITGPIFAAPYQSNLNYSTQQSNLSTYYWTAPPMAIITNGQGNSSIQLDFGEHPGVVSAFEITNQGCLNGPESIWVDTTSSVGLNNAKDSECSITYNESQHQLIFKGIKSKTIFKLYDLNGKQILSKESADENVSLQLPETISEGVYIIEISNGKHLINKKIIIR